MTDTRIRAFSKQEPPRDDRVDWPPRVGTEDEEEGVYLIFEDTDPLLCTAYISIDIDHAVPLEESL